MPRLVHIEEKLLSSTHEDLQKRNAFETGLLLALQGAKSDTILRFIRTPDTEEAQQASTLSPEWLVEHATQVARMLPGGVVVVGLYVLAPTSKFATVESKLLSVLTTLAKRLSSRVAEKQAILLQLPTDSRRATCRSAAHGATKLQPTELKPVPAPTQVHQSCRVWSCSQSLIRCLESIGMDAVSRFGHRLSGVGLECGQSRVRVRSVRLEWDRVGVGSSRIRVGLE